MVILAVSLLVKRTHPWHWRLLAQNGLCLNKQTLSTSKRRMLGVNCQLGIIPGKVQLLHHAWEQFWTVVLGMDWNHIREHHDYLMAQTIIFQCPGSFIGSVWLASNSMSKTFGMGRWTTAVQVMIFYDRWTDH